MMKTKFFVALAGIAVATAGCITTVSGTKTAAVPFVRDSVEGRYERSVDEVYRAAVQVMNSNGVMLTEYIPHDSTNAARALKGRVNQNTVWIRAQQTVDPKITEVSVEARTKWGGRDLDMVHELEKEIALQLAR
jgi:hypothetical protein